MWSSSETAKLSRSRAASRSTCPWIFRSTLALGELRGRCRRSAPPPRRLAAGVDVEELAAVATGGEVRDDVKLLVRRLERALDRRVEAGRDDEQLRQPARRSSGGRAASHEWRSEGSTSRSSASCSSSCSGADARCAPRPPARRTPARARPARARSARRGAWRSSRAGDAAHARPEHRHEPAGAERAQHLVVVVLQRLRRGREQRPVLAEDRRRTATAARAPARSRAPRRGCDARRDRRRARRPGGPTA